MKNNIKELKRLKGSLWIIIFIYIIWMFFIGDIKKSYLLGHIVLAWIPLQISTLIQRLNYKSKKKKYLKFAIVILALLWMLFYPKSLYMLTDYIYMCDKKYFSNLKYISYIREPAFIINNNIKIWIDLITIILGVFIGYTLGFLSLYINQTTLSKCFGNTVSWVFVVVTSIIGGFSIYADRFFSMDNMPIKIRIFKMLYVIENYFSGKAIGFTLIFSFLILMIYFMTYLIVNIKSILNG